MTTSLWAELADAWAAQNGDHVFDLLGYERNCLIRQAARKTGTPEDALPPALRPLPGPDGDSGDVGRFGEWQTNRPRYVSCALASWTLARRQSMSPTFC